VNVAVAVVVTVLETPPAVRAASTAVSKVAVVHAPVG
jgi:hypothetical protein